MTPSKVSTSYGLPGSKMLPTQMWNVTRRFQLYHGCRGCSSCTMAATHQWCGGDLCGCCVTVRDQVRTPQSSGPNACSKKTQRLSIVLLIAHTIQDRRTAWKRTPSWGPGTPTLLKELSGTSPVNISRLSAIKLSMREYETFTSCSISCPK